MARPEKQGLDYFSMDVEKDNKLKFLKAKFGTLGFGMYVELLQFIYKEGYFVYRDDDAVLLFMSETGLKEEETELMLEFMLLKGLFNKDLFDKYKILTSNGIQKRYAEGSKKRKNTRVQERFRCVGEYDHIELMDTLIELKEEETELKDTESTQSKGKESKVNKRKVKESEPTPKKPKEVKYPTVEEVEQYFQDNQYTRESARRAHKYYESADWHDGQGNKVLSRKQKMISVRFKEENKMKVQMKTLTPEEIAERNAR